MNLSCAQVNRAPLPVSHVSLITLPLTKLSEISLSVRPKSCECTVDSELSNKGLNLTTIPLRLKEELNFIAQITTVYDYRTR